jgi:hypothetical protein
MTEWKVRIKMDKKQQLLRKVSDIMSKKFALLTGGGMVRNYEAVIGLNNNHFFKIDIDSNGELDRIELVKESELKS